MQSGGAGVFYQLRTRPCGALSTLLVLLLLAPLALASDLDGDTVEDAEDNCPIAYNTSQRDGDSDGVGDACDNCLFVANPRAAVPDPARTYDGGQLDDDADGVGNACDADFTEARHDEFVDIADVLLLLDAYGSRISDSDCVDPFGEMNGSCARYDLSESGEFIDASDLRRLIAEDLFGKAASGNRGISSTLLSMNEQLEALGTSYRIGQAEWVTVTEAAIFGQTVFADDRAKQFVHHFAPEDPRRGGRVDISYQVDQGDGATSTGLSSVETTAAIDRAMATWIESTQCSDLELSKLPDGDFELGRAQFLLGFGPLPERVADITHGGWMPRGFFDRLAYRGGDYILAVTFTAIFADETPSWTDINGDGKMDVAFREIYYNDNFAWGIDVETDPFDVETVALHEAGHGLSQGHFGKLFRTDSNGKLHFAPFAVMNAVMSRQAQVLEGTDHSGHCSIWGSWPSK
jgi:hypothetical protein